MNIEEIAEKAKNRTMFDYGFDDCQKGLKPTSDNDNYLQGYGYAYELGEKQSASQYTR